MMVTKKGWSQSRELTARSKGRESCGLFRFAEAPKIVSATKKNQERKRAAAKENCRRVKRCERSKDSLCYKSQRAQGKLADFKPCDEGNYTPEMRLRKNDAMFRQLATYWKHSPIRALWNEPCMTQSAMRNVAQRRKEKSDDE